MPSVRTSLRALLAMAAVVAGTAGAPAHADPLPVCPIEGSHVIREFDTFGGYHTRIAYYAPSDTEVDVCIQTLGSVQTVIALTSDVQLLPPQANRSAGTESCARSIVDMTDPVRLTLSAGASLAQRDVCFEIDGTATTISLSGGSFQSVPSVAIWLPANSFLNQWGWCGRYYAYYQLRHDDEARKQKWIDCYQQDNRVG
jgi:hypothetical protein